MTRKPWRIHVGMVLLLIACDSSRLWADEKDDQIRLLQTRVAQLESRVVELEKLNKVQPGMATAQQRQELQAQAQQRMRRDSAKYTADQIGEAEQLYQVANKNWRSQAARDNLKTMIEKFPDLNRTGCATLYLGQMAKGDEREQYLKTAIEKFDDCFYGDGVQVGAFARYVLAVHYHDLKQFDKSKSLFDELIQKYPESIDHSGRLLSMDIEQVAKPAAPATQP